MKKKHLYNTKLGKVPWFIKRFGAAEVFLKPARMVFAPAILSRLPRKTFQFEGETLELFYNSYNITWATERCVEVPIGRYYAQQYKPGSVLEIGNVLSHYGSVSHDILDKFEKGPSVINADILTFQPSKKYDLVLSISTFEHFGFDDEADEPSSLKISRAVSSCRNFLSASGTLAITVPIGYNPELDLLLSDGSLSPNREIYLKKYGRLDWRECGKAEALRAIYKSRFPYANAIGVLEFRAA